MDRSRPRMFAAVAALLAAVSIVGYLAYTSYESDPAIEGTGMDFRDAGYYAGRGIVDGVNIYDVVIYRSTYPVGQEFPVLPPTYAALHIPFLVLEYVPALVLFVLLGIAANLALCAWAIRLAGWPVALPTVLITAAALLISNGGRFNLIVGQATLAWVAASYLALTAMRWQRGWWGVAIALTKPTYGGPIGLFLLGEGRWRRVAAGAAVAAVVAATLLVPIITWAGGPDEFVSSLRDNWETSFENPGASLETTTVRVDVAAAVKYVTGWSMSSAVEIAVGLTMLGIGVLAVRSAARRGAPRELLVVVAVVGTLTSVYRVGYDLVFLLLPILMVLRREFAGGERREWRLLVVALLLLAAFNPANTLVAEGVLPEALFRVVGPGVTALSLLLAYAVAARWAFSWGRTSEHAK